MSRGYTTSTLLCFCALSFIFGRFVQEIPGLPQTKSGVRISLETIRNMLELILMWHHGPGYRDAAISGALIPGMGFLQFTQSGGAASKTSRRQAIEKPVQQAQIHQQSGTKPQVPPLLPGVVSYHLGGIACHALLDHAHPFACLIRRNCA